MLCVVIDLAAHNERTHLVRPGETYTSIAKKYGVTLDELRKCNSLISECHTGALLVIPETAISHQEVSKSINTKSPKSKSVSRSVAKNFKTAENPYVLMQQGLIEIKDCDYASAKKIFTSVLKIETIPEAFYYRGLCHYKKEHWKLASRDFYNAYYDSELDASLKDDAKSLYTVSKSRHEEKVERRREAWAEVGKILGETLLVAGAVAADVAMQASYGTMSTSYSSPSSYSSGFSGVASMSNSQFSSYIDSQLTGLLAMTISQAQQQEMAQFNQFRTYNKKSDGSDYTLDEYRALQGQAIMDLKEQGIDVIGEMREQQRQNKLHEEELRKKEKAERFERMGYDAPASTKSPASSSSSQRSSSDKASATSSKSASVSSSNYGNSDKQDPKQQYRNGMVSSEDYDEIKKVTLYRRNGNSSSVSRSNVPLCKKGAYHYIKIGDKYYSVNYSNWQSYDRQILYGTTILYFNM